MLWLRCSIATFSPGLLEKPTKILHPNQLTGMFPSISLGVSLNMLYLGLHAHDA